MTSAYDGLLAHRTLAVSPTVELIGLVLSGNQNGGERVEAAEILGYRRCSQAIPALCGMLREGSPSHSVAAAQALAKIGVPTAILHLEQVYQECKAICSGTHMHSDDNRLSGVLTALLCFSTVEELQQASQQTDGLESMHAGIELEKRRAVQRLEQLLSRGQAMSTAVAALHGSGVVENWVIPFAVEAITGLPSQDARYVVFCALREGN